MDSIAPALKISLKELVDQSTFGEVAASFTRLFDISVRIFDLDGNLLVEAEKQNPLCRYLESLSGARGRCTERDLGSRFADAGRVCDPAGDQS